MQQISIRIDDKTAQALEKLAQKTGRSKTFYVKQAILNQLEDLEDYYLGVNALKEFQQSGAKAIPADEVFKKLGL
jgi:RHH-type rel operon transcriptional repressor/antitoxin RelB